MKTFVRQRSFSRCGPLLISGAAALVLTVFLLVIKRRPQPGDEEHSSDRSNPGEPGPGEREGSAPDDNPGSEGSDQRVQASEDGEEVDGDEEDEDYVVISKDEVREEQTSKTVNTLGVGRDKVPSVSRLTRTRCVTALAHVSRQGRFICGSSM